MGKKKLDISAFMGEPQEAIPAKRTGKETEQTTPKGKEQEKGKEEYIVTSFRLKRSFLKELRMFALEQDMSAVSVIEAAVREYMAASKG